MKEYEFTLKFTLPDRSIDPDLYVDRLAEEGCDDALVGIGRKGRISLQFNRESENSSEAVLSALRNVKKAIPGARLIGVEPDLVGLTDVADLMGFSRQNMRKIMINNGDSFPLPVYDGTPSLWRLFHVLAWLKEQQQYPVDDSIMDIANTTMHLNIAREVTSLDRHRISHLVSENADDEKYFEGLSGVNKMPPAS